MDTGSSCLLLALLPSFPVVTGLVEVVGSFERSCPVCGVESDGVAGVVGSVAAFSSVF